MFASTSLSLSRYLDHDTIVPEIILVRCSGIFAWYCIPEYSRYTASFSLTKNTTVRTIYCVGQMYSMASISRELTPAEMPRSELVRYRDVWGRLRYRDTVSYQIFFYLLHPYAWNEEGKPRPIDVSRGPNQEARVADDGVVRGARGGNGGGRMTASRRAPADEQERGNRPAHAAAAQPGLIAWRAASP